MNDIELIKLQRLFSKVDQKDAASLYKWFTDHSYLNISDHALVMDRCTRKVRELRILAGLKGRKPTTNKRPVTIKIQIAELPTNWRTKEWLESYINKYGTMAVQRATGLSVSRFYEIVHKLNVKIKGRTESKNPNCTKAWCHKHYVELGLSLRQCAKLAGITHPRFADWLVKFKIPIRPRYLKSKTQLPFSFKVFIAKLSKQKIVRQVILYPAHIHVRYHDETTARYHFKSIPANDWTIEHVPKIAYQYHDGISDNRYSAHIIITRSSLDRANRFERDLALHAFNKLITKRGWVWPLFPDDVLANDLRSLYREKENSYIKGGSFTVLNKGPGKILLQHFFDLSHIWDSVLRKPRVTYNMIKSLYNTRKDVNLSNLIKTIARHGVKHKLKLPNPTLYRFLFQKLKIDGPVLDLHVGSGARAIGCALANLQYLHLNDTRFIQAVELGFDTLLNVNHDSYDNRNVNRLGLVIGDEDLGEFSIETALKYADKARRILVYVPREKKEEYRVAYQPTSIIKIITNPIKQDPNYFFLW